MKQTIKIKEIIPMTAKSGNKYTKIQTDKGDMTVFEDDVVAKLKEHYGKYADVEVAENEKGFKNIRQFYNAADAPKTEEPVKVETVKPESFAEPVKATTKAKPFDKDPVGLAVDVFIAMMNHSNLETSEVMKLAIEVTKQAQDAFKEE